MKVKKTPVLRVDQKHVPGIQILIGTTYQTERDGEVVDLFIQRTMRMSLQSAHSHHTHIPGLHPLLLKERSGQREFLAATRQVCVAQM